MNGLLAVLTIGLVAGAAAVDVPPPLEEPKIRVPRGVFRAEENGRPR